MQEGQSSNQPGWVFSPGGQATPPQQLPPQNNQAQAAQQPLTEAGVSIQRQTPDASQPLVAEQPQPMTELPAPVQPVTAEVVLDAPILQQALPLTEQAQPQVVNPALSPAPPQQLFAPQLDNAMTNDVQPGIEAPMSSEDIGQPITADITKNEDFHIRWSAAEYIAGQKGASWFMLYAAVAVAVTVAIFLATKDILTLVIISVLAIAVGVFAAQKPKDRDYALGDKGVMIGNRYYPYELFRSFAVMYEGDSGFVSLMPAKRFMPTLAMYYAPQEEDSIVEELGDHLPYEERSHDVVDRISRRMRF